MTIGQIEKKSDSLEIWTYSIGNFFNLNAEKIIEKKYPFKVKAIAGDVITEHLSDSIENHNNEVWNYLDLKGYSSLKEKYKLDLNAEIGRIKKAVEISQMNKIVYKLYSDLEKLNLQNYTELDKINDNNYNFKVYSFDLKNLDKEQILEMKFTVELKSGKTRITE